MSFPAFNLFFQKLTFQRSKNQLKNLSFVSVFSFCLKLETRIFTESKHLVLQFPSTETCSAVSRLNKHLV
jgi:hypothetical protein